MTVEVDAVSVESRLSGGRLSCPVCPGVLGPWGWARARRVHGLAGPVRPRRARCRDCLVTHVLLPVTLLLRRGYAAALVMAVLMARAAGRGHRAIAVDARVPTSTVRGWLRRMSGRVEQVRACFARVAVEVGVDLEVPSGAGSPWRDMLAAVGAATEALRARFGMSGAVGKVTAAQVAAAVSNGRLLAPDWPGAGSVNLATRVASAALGV